MQGRTPSETSNRDPNDVAHQPVLVPETLAYLAPERGGLFVDCTLGLGGHSESLLRAAEDVVVLGIDRDADALRRATRRLEPFGERFRAALGRFGDLDELLDAAGVERVAGLFADLGVSSMQLDQPERGFSFQKDGPLDMRMGGGEMTARDVVNSYPEEKLQRIFSEYGEERRARRIARSIVRAREQGPLETTRELRRVVTEAQPPVRPGRRRIDPATRVFQALRIEVNQELSELQKLLEQGIRRLDTDGRIVILSYHSLEDRVVKNAFRDAERGEKDPVTGRSLAESKVLEVLTRKPVRPGEIEIATNPRSRSARLRAARRL